MIVIDSSKCPQNHICPAVKVCPVGALKQEGYKAPTIDYNKCINCGRCIAVCPTKAITFKIKGGI